MKDAVSKLHNFYVANNMGEMNQVVGEVLDEIARLRAENKKLTAKLEHEEGQVDRLNGLLVEQYNTCRCRVLTAQLDQAKELLQQSDCPRADGVNTKCIDGKLNTLLINGWYEVTGLDCKFCEKRKQFIGDTLGRTDTP